MATILVVDDEDAVRSMLVKFLIRHAHTVLSAKNGIEGLSVFQAHKGEIDLVITDVLMPEMSGPDLVYRLGLLPQKRPVRIIMMTGYSGGLLATEGRTVTRIIQKPFEMADFLMIIADELSRIPSEH